MLTIDRRSGQQNQHYNRRFGKLHIIWFSAVWLSYYFARYIEARYQSPTCAAPRRAGSRGDRMG